MSSASLLIGLRGHVIDSPKFGELRSWPNGGVIVADGRIVEVGDYDQISKKNQQRDIHWLSASNNVIVPGLVDLHTHLPQYPAVAKGESQLLPWLRQHIFPLEREFTGPKSRKSIPTFFQELARNGSTTAVVYTAVFEDSCDAAFEAARKLGNRAIIGKMMMDVGSYGQHQPRKVASISLHESERLCKKWHGENEGLLEYAFSPRFAVSCTDKLMRGAAELANKYDAYIQTHLSENGEEIDKVCNQFSWAKNYTDVYAQTGMLGPKSVVGHCVHLDEEEVAQLAESGAAIAHCPTSNLFLGSGIMRFDELHDAGIRIGLGSDVAAGPELNLWQVMRSAVDSQKARSFYQEGVKTLTPGEAFHLATQGGADALGKGATIGSFDPGKEADILVLDLAELVPYGKRSIPKKGLSAEDIISLCVYRGGPQAVLSTYVRGKKIFQAPEQALFG